MSDFNIKLSDRVARELYDDLKEIVNAITYVMVTEHIAPNQYISQNADTNIRRAVENYVFYGLFGLALSQRDDYVLRIPYLTLDEMGSTGKNTIDRLTPRARAAVKTYDIDLSGCANLEQARDHILGLYDACIKRQEQAEELERMRREHEVSKIIVTPAATEAAVTTPASAPEVATQAITEQELDSLEEIPDAEFEQEQEEKAEEVEQEEELAQDELEGDAHKQMPLAVDQEEGTEEQAEEEDDAPFDNSDIVIEQEDEGREESEAAEDAAMKALEAILGKKNQ